MKGEDFIGFFRAGILPKQIISFIDFFSIDWKQHNFFFPRLCSHCALWTLHDLFLPDPWYSRYLFCWMFSLVCPALLCPSLGAVFLVLGAFQGPGSDSALQMVCGNYSCLCQGQDAWSMNPCSQLVWNWDFQVQSDKCVIVTCISASSPGVTAHETELICLKKIKKIYGVRSW